MQHPVWELAQKALINRDSATLGRLLLEHGKLFSEQQPPQYGTGGLSPDYSGGDAEAVITRNHHFDSWAEVGEFDRALGERNSPVAQFEAAVDAIVTGDIATLDRLLRDNPELIRMRSTRRHHATLLHYVGANGVEGFRQKTPSNIVGTAERLLKAGAEVDARAGMYGGSTTLGLVVTSIHPWLAGVLEPLVALLLKHGAALDGARVNDCLANGRLRGAELMAGHGALVDFEGAAGLGRMDLVRGFFGDSTVTGAQMNNAFTWACEFGRMAVVDFLLERGMEVGAKMKRGQTGLHRAAYGGHVDVVKLLLERGAPVNAEDDTWGSTPLGWALHGWRERSNGESLCEVADLLIAAGATEKKPAA